MHIELSAFLTDVWENRDGILYRKDDPTPIANDPTGTTVEDRVYAVYAPQHGQAKGAITRDRYTTAVNAIKKPPQSGWTVDRRDWAFVWRNVWASQTADHRVYVNAKLEHAPAIFEKIMGMAVLPLKGPPVPPRPGQTNPVLPAHVLRTGHLTQANRGHFGETVAAAKIAFAEEAFSGRPDRIVVYVNAGPAVAAALARKIAALGNLFEHDHPPMTQRIASGISIGAEVGAGQWSVGTSFANVRCNLIAWAMIEAVTGQATDAGPNDVPLAAPAAGSPNRLDFVRLVESKFRRQNIDVDAPWR